MEADSVWDGPSAAESYSVMIIEWSSIVLAWVALFALLVGALIVAFRTRRPGGYWMLAGIAMFVVGIVHTFLKPHNYYDPSLIDRAFYFLGPVVPFFFFSVGLCRLAWSLRGEKAKAEDQ